MTMAWCCRNSRPAPARAGLEFPAHCRWFAINHEDRCRFAPAPPTPIATHRFRPTGKTPASFSWSSLSSEHGLAIRLLKTTSTRDFLQILRGDAASQGNDGEIAE